MIPHVKLPAIAVIATLLVTFASGQDSSSNKKPYVRTGQEATLSGTVTFTGKPPEQKRIDMSADPICEQINSDPRDEWLVVSNERLANVLIYATSTGILDDYRFGPPKSEVVLEQRGCRYRPRVLAIQAGQTLIITNGDQTTHNTHPFPKNNPEWNQTRVVGAPPLMKTFQRAELLIPLKCNQHPWEKAHLSVFSHPFFAVSDALGNYRIEGLPPGSYKITAWHEKLGEKSAEVTMVPGESRFVEFAFAATDLNGSK